MLDGLDDIDWASLHHAYGEATDVPDLLRALASPVAKERSDAMYALYGNIWHQGTVYEATSVAVPFLIDLLREPDVQSKAAILGLLQAISRGSSFLEAHQEMEGYRDKRATAPFQEQLRKESNWVRKAKDAVEAGLPVYVGLLTARSAGLRVLAAYVLANCTGRVAEVAVVLRRRLRHERQPSARAAVLWAWASLARGARRTLRRLAQSREEKPLIRLLAVCALLRDAPEKAYPRLTRFCAAALARCPRRLARLPWAEGEPVPFVAGALVRQPAMLLELLTRIVEAPDHPCREAALYHLDDVCLWQPAAREPVAALLGTLLDSGNTEVRRHAARQLGTLGSSSRAARESLVKALADADPEVVRHAASALAKMGDARAVPFLIEQLAQGQGNAQVFADLKRLGPAARAAVPLLRELLATQRGNTRVLVAHALALMGEASSDAIPDVADVLGDPLAAQGAAWALVQWGPLARAALPQLMELVTAGPSSGRVNAIKALGALGLEARSAVPILERLLHDAHAETRIAAADALWAITPRADHVVPVPVDALTELAGARPRKHACSDALEVLERLGPAGQAAAPLVRQLLDDTYQWTRIRAARVLWRMGEPLEVFLPTVIEELRCRPVGLLAASCLAEIGPAAAAALPRLRELRDAPGSISEGGIMDEIIEKEEEFRAAVAGAVVAIEGVSPGRAAVNSQG